MSKKKVFIGPSSFANFSKEPLILLENRGILFEMNPYGKALTEDQIYQKIYEVDGILAGLEPLNKRVLSNAHNLKVISRVGAGTDTVDLEEAKKLGIPVENTPDGPTDAVAELTLTFILMLLRKIIFQDNNLKNGNWKRLPGNLLKGKTVGIIGFGRIGRRLSALLVPFEVLSIFFDPYVMESEEEAKKVELDYLLQNADVVSLHVPYSEETHELMNRDRIALMKKNALLINASRGGLVKEDALFEFLKENRIGGAAIDTFSEEPYHGKLCQCENVVLTPHIGSFAQETRVQMEIEAVNNLLRYL